MKREGPPNCSKRFPDSHGELYRSTWEAEVSDLLKGVGCDFEYERRDEVTGTHPDFYFKNLAMYLEIHPVLPDQKVIPPNCVLTTTKEASLVTAEVLALLDACCYLKQKLLEESSSTVPVS